VYSYGTNTWANAAPATAPSARHVYALAYGGQSKAILFGGNLLDYCCAVEDDTWEYVPPAN